ncbi:AMP-binding protein [Streptomyces sp. NA04227]|uniref:AMP-binding protein n=1 Tax=Streptomyces sp. NA04227 TaxID=2742136 RepID=UPI000A20ABC2|nr:AMP-binding protein [Streptomyces sp. NA04227]ARM20260.1 SauE [Streptomyces sp.]QKW07486.1 AMP-binding protein [Streptomyces sp. NA04227]
MSETAAPTTGQGNAALWYLDRHLGLDTADAVALITEEGELTYRQLHERVCKAARVLADSGLGPGDRMVTVLPDGVLPVALVLAAMRLGAVPVPVSPLLTAEEQRYIVEDSGAVVVVHDDPAGEVAADFAERFPRAVLLTARPGGERPLPELVDAASPLWEAVARDGEDMAVIQYTSGSTGRPKGVVHLHRGLLAFPQGIGAHLGIGRADRVLSTAKLPFGYGFGNSLLLPFAVGASAILFRGRAEPHLVADLVQRHRPTVLFAVPTLYAAMLTLAGTGRRPDLSGVRLAVSAGEHLGALLGERFEEAYGLTLVNGLGSTECLHIFLATVAGVSPHGVTGVPVPGFEVQVCDEEDRVLPAGEMGHLRVRGPSTGARYLGLSELSAQTFRDGWVYTGDTLVDDPEGGWMYLGRSDSILNVGGLKILPSEIEDVINALEGVAGCAVVGVRDENEITRIVAHVVPRDPDDAGLRRTVIDAAREQLPVFKRPQTVRVVEELPVTSTGKTARHLIRRREMEKQS